MLKMFFLSASPLMVLYFVLSNKIHLLMVHISIELPHEENIFAIAKVRTQIRCSVTPQLISAFVLATQTLQSIFYLYPKL